MTRSSISRVMPNSDDSGSATAAMPENMMATAIRPGRRTCQSPRRRPTAMGLPPPMRGRMKVKTNRNSSGCIPTRSRKGMELAGRTRKSRRNSPRKALKKIAVPKAAVSTRSLTPDPRSYSRKSLPVSWMKTVSRLGSVICRSRRP